MVSGLIWPAGQQLSVLWGFSTGGQTLDESLGQFPKSSAPGTHWVHVGQTLSSGCLLLNTKMHFTKLHGPFTTFVFSPHAQSAIPAETSSSAIGERLCTCMLLRKLVTPAALGVILLVLSWRRLGRDGMEDECVVGEWSPFSPCSGCGGHSTRVRRILAKGAMSGECPVTREQVSVCLSVRICPCVCVCVHVCVHVRVYVQESGPVHETSQ